MTMETPVLAGRDKAERSSRRGIRNVEAMSGVRVAEPNDGYQIGCHTGIGNRRTAFSWRGPEGVLVQTAKAEENDVVFEPTSGK